MLMNDYHRLVRPEAVGSSRSEFRRPGGGSPPRNPPWGSQGIARASDGTRHPQRLGARPPAPSETGDMPQKTSRRSRVFLRRPARTRPTYSPEEP